MRFRGLVFRRFISKLPNDVKKRAFELYYRCFK